MFNIDVAYRMFLAKKPATTPLDVKLFVQGQFEDRYSDAQVRVDM